MCKRREFVWGVSGVGQAPCLGIHEVLGVLGRSGERARVLCFAATREKKSDVLPSKEEYVIILRLPVSEYTG